jgi:hypothetical protein
VAKEKPQHEPGPEDKADATTPTQADAYAANAAGANPAKAAEKRGRSAPRKKGASLAADPDEGPDEDEPAPPMPEVKDPDLAGGDRSSLTSRKGGGDVAELTKRVTKLEKQVAKLRGKKSKK